MKKWKKELTDKLREKVAELPPDTRFYSIRTLMHEFQTSQRTVEEVIQVLIDEKKLVRRAGRGVYTRKKTDAGSFHLQFCYPQWPSLQFQYLERACSAYAKQNGFTFTSKPIEQGDGFYDAITPGESDALLICPPREPISMKSLQLLEKLNVPFALVAENVGNFEISTLYDDTYAAGAIAAAHLINHGHKKLAVLFTEPHCFVSDSLCRSFCLFAYLKGVSVKIIETELQSWNDGRLCSKEALTEYLKKNGLDFTGLFMISASPALEVYKVFADFGYSIPDDVSIITNDDYPNNQLMNPPLDSVAVDWTSSVGHCIEQLRKAAEGNLKYFQQRITPELVVRQSTADYHKPKNPCK